MAGLRTSQECLYCEKRTSHDWWGSDLHADPRANSRPPYHRNIPPERLPRANHLRVPIPIIPNDDPLSRDAALLNHQPAPLGDAVAHLDADSGCRSPHS